MEVKWQHVYMAVDLEKKRVTDHESKKNYHTVHADYIYYIRKDSTPATPFTQRCVVFK